MSSVAHPGSALHLWSRSDPVAATMPPLTDELWASALSLDAFIETAAVHRDLWQTTRRLARVDAVHASAVDAMTGGVRLLVLLEDWCGDAIHTIPVVARLIEPHPQLAMRVVRRDTHDALMNLHRTDASRSIPVVIAYGADDTERGWWGPRPTALQQWVIADGLALPLPERYHAIRTWYARDRGATTVAEIVRLLEHAHD